jgi:hypothetical protein
MQNYTVILFCSMILLLGSCSRKAGESSGIVTKRIQYDVNIKSPDPEFDWWVQNLEGEQRELLIQNVFSAVSKGRVKAYDYFSYRVLTDHDLNQMLHKTDTVALQRSFPPYDYFDTVISQNIEFKNITRMRFLEEWNMDSKTLVFTKKVAGICPLLEAYNEIGELKGYTPLFWVFFDDEYPGKFKLN